MPNGNARVRAVLEKKGNIREGGRIARRKIREKSANTTPLSLKAQEDYGVRTEIDHRFFVEAPVVTLREGEQGVELDVEALVSKLPEKDFRDLKAFFSRHTRVLPQNIANTPSFFNRVIFGIEELVLRERGGSAPVAINLLDHEHKRIVSLESAMTPFQKDFVHVYVQALVFELAHTLSEKRLNYKVEELDIFLREFDDFIEKHPGWKLILPAEVWHALNHLDHLGTEAHREACRLSVMAPELFEPYPFLIQSYLPMQQPKEGVTPVQQQVHQDLLESFLSTYQEYTQKQSNFISLSTEDRKAYLQDYQQRFTQLYSSVTAAAIMPRSASELQESILLILFYILRDLEDYKAAAVYLALMQLEIKKREGTHAEYFNETTFLNRLYKDFACECPAAKAYANDLVTWQSIIIMRLSSVTRDLFELERELTHISNLVRDKMTAGVIGQEAGQDLMFFIHTYALKILVAFELTLPLDRKIVRQLNNILLSQMRLYQTGSEGVSPHGVDFITLEIKAQGMDETLLESAAARQKTLKALCPSIRKKNAFVMLPDFGAALDSDAESEEEDGCGPEAVV